MGGWRRPAPPGPRRCSQWWCRAARAPYRCSARSSSLRRWPRQRSARSFRNDAGGAGGIGQQRAGQGNAGQDGFHSNQQEKDVVKPAVAGPRRRSWGKAAYRKTADRSMAPSSWTSRPRYSVEVGAMAASIRTPTVSVRPLDGDAARRGSRRSGRWRPGPRLRPARARSRRRRTIRSGAPASRPAWRYRAASAARTRPGSCRPPGPGPGWPAASRRAGCWPGDWRCHRRRIGAARPSPAGRS